MSEGRNRFGWIYKLTLEALRDELSRRGLDTEGEIPNLHARMLQHELDLTGALGSQSPSGEGPIAHLHPAPLADMRPDSPSNFDVEDVVRVTLGRTRESVPVLLRPLRGSRSELHATFRHRDL